MKKPLVVKPIRAFVLNATDQERMSALTGLKPAHIYRADQNMKWVMRPGELLGVFDGLRVFGKFRKEMVEGLQRVKAWGAVAYDVETGMRSDLDGAEMLDRGLAKVHAEATMPTRAKALMMVERRLAAKEERRMLRSEAQAIWLDMTYKVDEAVRLMPGWTQASAYRTFGPRGAKPGRRSKDALAADPNRGFIYFIRENGKGHVKIGFAKSIKQRLTTLQISHHGKLEVVGAIGGTMKIEKSLHRQFADYRLSGEWFRVAGELKKFMATLPKYLEQ